MKKEERHQIKRDELATVLERAEVFVETNVRQVLIIAGVVLVLVVAGLGVRSWLAGREARAAALLGELIRTYRSPVAASLEALQNAPPGTTPFTTAAERDGKVLEQAEALLAGGATKAAPKARYYRALALAGLGRGDEAVAGYEDLLRRHPDDFVAPMARLQLARLREGRGEAAEALAIYQTLEQQAGAVPPEEGILGSARCQEVLGRKDEALKAYRRIISEFPESEYASEARRKVEELSCGR